MSTCKKKEEEEIDGSAIFLSFLIRTVHRPVPVPLAVEVDDGGALDAADPAADGGEHGRRRRRGGRHDDDDGDKEVEGKAKGGMSDKQTAQYCPTNVVRPHRIRRN